MRRALHVSFTGAPDSDWLVADLPEIEAVPPFTRDRVHLLRHARGNVVLFPYGPGERWYVVDTGPAAAGEAGGEAAFLERRMAEASGRRVRLGRLAHVSRFTIPKKRAGTMREGRAVLLGDAAHVNSPASGRGMNTGIEDAATLGWRLALVVRGQAGEALLDGWAAERAAAARWLLAESWIGTRLVEAPPGPLHRALGALVALQARVGWLHRGVRRLYTGEMSGLAARGGAPRWPALPRDLADRPEGAALEAWAREQTVPALVLAGARAVEADALLAPLLPRWMPVAALGRDLPDPEGRLARRLGAGAHLVRPDGHLEARLPPEPPALLRALAALGRRGEAAEAA